METEVISAENIEIVKKRLEELREFLHYDVFNSELNIGDEEIVLKFPAEMEYIVYSIDEFLEYTDDIQEIKQVSNHTVRTSLVRQTILKIDRYWSEYTGLPYNRLEKDGYSVSFINLPFLIGCIATKEQWFNEDFGVPPCSFYSAIEIKYSDSSKVLDEKEEDELIYRILFYLSSKYSASVQIGKFITPDDLYGKTDTVEDDEEEYLIKESDLLSYAHSMNMYREALSISNCDIQFLYYYKIIEYFSPLVAKQKSYEILNQRLDTVVVCERTLSYLDSFFSLTRQYDSSMKDSELANTVLQNCIDIIPLFQFLPDTIKKKVRKQISVQEKDIETGLSPEKIIQMKKYIATILYETRNNIVHAKSNYTRTGNECENEDLAEMNNFMEKLCYCLIVWNDRLPDNMRLD